MDNICHIKTKYDAPSSINIQIWIRYLFISVITFNLIALPTVWFLLKFRAIIRFFNYLEIQSKLSTVLTTTNSCEYHHNLRPKWMSGSKILNLTFMGPCIANIFQYISKKMQLYTVYLCLETALHVSGGTSTHHQERIQLYLQWRTPPTAHSNRFQLFHDSGR